jgi:signal peptidase I
MKGQSMENTIQNNQLIYIAKYKFGIKIPFIEKPILTLTGPENKEVVAFHYPKIYDKKLSQKPVMVSRCIGQPGDTLQIVKKEIFLNSKPIVDIPTIQLKYRLFSEKGDLTDDFLNEYSITQGGKVNEVGLYDFPLTEDQAKVLEKDNRISGLRILRDKPGDLADIFPFSGYYAFSADDFGPVKIPQQGWTVSINKRNIDLYKQIISVYENNTLRIVSDKVFINGEEAFSYTFKNDYYFVLDDNRDYADDSRFWGFLPADHLYGMVIGY